MPGVMEVLNERSETAVKRMESTVSDFRYEYLLVDFILDYGFEGCCLVLRSFIREVVPSQEGCEESDPQTAAVFFFCSSN